MQNLIISNVRDLGTSSNRWKSLYLGTDLNVAGVSTFANTVISGVTTHSNDVVFVGGGGADITYDASNDNLEFQDAAEAVFGTNGDLRLHHTSNISTIKDSLWMICENYGDTIRIQRQAGGENFLYMTEGGTARLHVDDGLNRLETTPAGVGCFSGHKSSYWYCNCFKFHIKWYCFN